MYAVNAVHNFGKSRLLWTPKYREKFFSFNVRRYTSADVAASPSDGPMIITKVGGLFPPKAGHDVSSAIDSRRTPIARNDNTFFGSFLASREVN